MGPYRASQKPVEAGDAANRDLAPMLAIAWLASAVHVGVVLFTGETFGVAATLSVLACVVIPLSCRQVFSRSAFCTTVHAAPASEPTSSNRPENRPQNELFKTSPSMRR